MTAIETIGIVGAGAWGTALAQVAARAGRAVTLWAREPEVADSINTARENSLFLKGVPLDSSIRATTTLADLADVDALLLVTPAQFLRPTLAELSVHLPQTTPIVLCSKGIEQGTGLLMTEVCAAVAGAHPLAVLSGPTFAAEVAKGLPTAITLACADKDLGSRFCAAIGLPTFRPYWSADVIGAEVGGAVKNVLAIACGIAEGKQLGENARAALITRGFAEMIRFGKAKGAQYETLAGLCGLGDLILTCSSVQSRNMSLGMAIGQGRRMNDILAERKTVAEGAHTAPVLLEAAKALGVDMPITEAVVQLLYHDADVDTVVHDLLRRPFRPE